MSASGESPRSTVQEWMADGRLYIAGGVTCAIISLVVVPLVGLIAVYSGYKLYVSGQHTTVAMVIAGTGAAGFLYWVVYLVWLYT